MAFSRRFPIVLGALACSFVALCSTPSFADEASLVVLKSVGAAFKPGDKVSGATPLKLADGQSVSLIASDGHLIALKGPYDGPIQKAAEIKSASVTDLVSPLFNSAKDEKATPGVIRAGAGAGPDVDPWVIDASTSGEVCVHQAVSYEVWRPEMAKPETVVIVPVSGGAETKIDFDAKENRVGVPDSLNFQDGQKYKFSRDGKVSEITVHTIPEGVPLDKTVAAWMLQENCKVQAHALLYKMTHNPAS